MKHLAIDIESFSSAPFNKYGVYKYASSPDFEIPLFSHSADGGPIQVADFTAGEQLSAGDACGRVSGAGLLALHDGMVGSLGPSPLAGRAKTLSP